MPRFLRRCLGKSFLVGFLLLQVIVATALAQDGDPEEFTVNLQSLDRSLLIYRLFFPTTGSPTPSNLHALLTNDQVYLVREGDTLWSIALEFGRDVETIACAVHPNRSNPKQLIPGEQLTIPPQNTVCHTVSLGETLEDVAEMYGVEPDAILSEPWNQLQTTSTLRAGQRLRINSAMRFPSRRYTVAEPTPLPPPPDVVEELDIDGYPRGWAYGTDTFIWPVRGVITQRYHPRHRALDIAAPTGTPIVAANRGTVIRSGWSDAGYGLRVVIDHGNDYVTLYAHLSQIHVEVGQVVATGEVIGLVGSTGNSTGPHLHFEIYDFGYLVDPLTYLEQQ